MPKNKQQLEDEFVKWSLQREAARKCEGEIRESLQRFIDTTGLDPYYFTHGVELADPGDESTGVKGKLSVVNVNLYASDPKTGQRIRLDAAANGPHGG